jgi:hypothetical protein
MDSDLIRFTLSPAALPPVEVCLRRAGERWIARVEGSDLSAGMATSPRAALLAALEPFGQPAVTALLADLGLLEPSVRVLELQPAVAGS